MVTNNMLDYSVGNIGYMFFKVLLSVVLGAVVGYEREIHERPAGLRTHILVCTGSTLITLISIGFNWPGVDPSRIAAQIVTGIGFLCAGTILRQGNVVRGLTTAASIWTVAGIGMAAAVGGVFLWLGIFTTIIVFLTLTIMRRIEPAIGKRTVYGISLDVPAHRPEILGQVMQRLTDMDIILESITSSMLEEGRCLYRLRIALPHTVSPEQIVNVLNTMEGLDHFEVS